MLTVALLICLGTVSAYVWPSPQLDALESLRWDQAIDGFATFVDPCDQFAFDGNGNSGRSNTADWIRTAYHDMATYNVADGTGGMDASIRFSEEQARPENVGSGFNNINLKDAKAKCVVLLMNTLIVVAGPFSSRYVSIADVLALAAILAVDNCGGPEIPFRGGRVDAGEPNAPGVPQPQQDLDSHIAAFARQGFTQTEMISLVACGHTFGGVQHAVFPTIVPELNDPNNTESVAHFDSTFVHFDNNVATEYIAGTTQNPLVVGLNDTTNSDKRIFGSDGNVTMRSFADSPVLFASTCAELMGRMLDTVPSGVQLTDVVTPLPVKPDHISLILDGDTLQFSGDVRFWNLTEDPNRTVRLLWDDHLGGENNATLRFTQAVTGSGGRNTAVWYTFNPANQPFLSLDATAGITTMRFAVDNKLEDQGGLGFAAPDDVVFAASSCFIPNTNGIPTGRWDIAVRNDIKPTRVYLEYEIRDSVDRPIAQEIDVPPPCLAQQWERLLHMERRTHGDSGLQFLYRRCGSRWCQGHPKQRTANIQLLCLCLNFSATQLFCRGFCLGIFWGSHAGRRR
ncbi:Peroxidase [Mycena venus]|uniref:Peroxidase n=1 Tax=Mycena venus TaxID=2733690 RepID=A0A8H7CQ04_9AGAR|nr:Peroxidase [Mycena venus]